MIRKLTTNNFDFLVIKGDDLLNYDLSIDNNNIYKFNGYTNKYQYFEYELNQYFKSKDIQLVMVDEICDMISFEKKLFLDSICDKYIWGLIKLNYRYKNYLTNNFDLLNYNASFDTFCLSYNINEHDVIILKL